MGIPMLFETVRECLVSALDLTSDEALRVDRNTTAADLMKWPAESHFIRSAAVVFRSTRSASSEVKSSALTKHSRTVSNSIGIPIKLTRALNSRLPAGHPAG